MHQNKRTFFKKRNWKKEKVEKRKKPEQRERRLNDSTGSNVTDELVAPGQSVAVCVIHEAEALMFVQRSLKQLKVFTLLQPLMIMSVPKSSR